MFDCTLHPKRRLWRNPINTTRMSRTAAMLSSFCYNNELKSPNSRYNKHYSTLAIQSPLTGYIYLKFTVNCGFTMRYWQPFIALSAQNAKNIKNASLCHILSAFLYLLKSFPFFYLKSSGRHSDKMKWFCLQFEIIFAITVSPGSYLHCFFFFLKSDFILPGCPKAS